MNPNCLPRAFIAGRVRIIKARDKILSYMSSPEFKPREEVILEGDSPFTQMNASADSYNPVEIIDYQTNTIRLKADLTAPGWLVLSEVWYPGWRVYINGKSDKIYRVDYILRGIYLDKGSHYIEFVYQPISLKIGLIISLLTLFLLLIFTIVSGKIVKKLSS